MTALSDERIIQSSILRVASQVVRGEYFAGLFFIGCVSGLTSRLVQSVHENGWADALYGTFGISLIVWVSFVAGLSLLLRDKTVGISASDLRLSAGFVFLIVLPVGSLSWIAVTGLSLYVVASTVVASSRRGASILLAATVPMFWSPMLFQFCSPIILAVDAKLVSCLLGTDRTGNIVGFADGSAQLVIYPACSSLVNVSLAFLCWVTMSQWVNHRKSPYDIFWCLLACAAVITVNVSRITIAGLSQWHYATFHSEAGDAVVNLLILGLIVGICALGVRRELFQRT